MGGTKQDKAPVSHGAASSCCHKENAWRDHCCRVHLAVAVVIFWQSPPKMKKMRTKIYGCQHFEMPIVMQRTYLGSHHVII